MRPIVAILFFAVPAVCQSTGFVTALGGISTLSADAATQLGPPNLAGLYKPENGGAANVAAGFHLNDWLSVQGNYVWNANRVTLTAIADSAFLEEKRRATQHAGVADLLLYFRKRDSWARPYLSAGVGVVHLKDVPEGMARGTVPAVPGMSDTKAQLRVAVGIDLMHTSRWGFRYTFSESISGNPYSAILTPRGSRNMANFQNLFGVIRYFGRKSPDPIVSGRAHMGNAASKSVHSPRARQATAHGRPCMGSASSSNPAQVRAVPVLQTRTASARQPGFG